ncbi:MAG: RNA recognition motif domain-containing protein [Cyclobacteriaceae bacterium]|nr:RNA recognition motif domain-containing protein [Cyclobacteriaceae bacterium]
MKPIGVFLLLLIAIPALAQTKNYEADTKTVESTLSALYEVISGEPNQPRDWDRFRNLFKPEGRLIPTRKDESGNLVIKTLSPEEYVALFQSRIPTGFFERELSRKIETFGTVTHVFSTYETRDKKEGPVTNRGINSIQLFYDNNRYYIVNIFWCAESMGFELPKKYLSKK